MASSSAVGVRRTQSESRETTRESGPIKEELLAAIGVVINMRGTIGLAESHRVIQLLDEIGKR